MLVERIQWSWSNALLRLTQWLGGILILELCIGLLVGLLQGNSAGLIAGVISGLVIGGAFAPFALLNGAKIETGH